MNLFAWLMAGGLLGWLSGRMMRARSEPGSVLDVIVGMAGAFAAGYLVAPWLGIGSIHQQEFDLASLTVGATGAVVLLGLFNLFRRVFLR